MKSILYAVALLILIGGGFFLYEMFKGASAIYIVAWLNQGKPVAKFWEGINERTEKRINGEFKKDAQMRTAVGQVTRNSMSVTVAKIMSKLDLGGIEVMVAMDKFRLYDGEKVDIGRSDS